MSRAERIMAETRFKRAEQSKRVSISEIVNVLSHRPFATTRERGWAGVTVDMYDPLPDVSERYPALDHHLICYCPYGSARLVQGRDGVVHEGLVSAGVSMLMPAGYDSLWEGSASATARLRIPTALIADAAEQLGRSGTSFELRNVFETRDVVIEHIAQILVAEIGREHHPAQALIADQLSTALAAHLLRTYNAFEPIVPGDAPPLGKRDMARLTEYIEESLDRPIGLAELAAIVNVSRFHFTRLFKRSTGMTASSFVERCRIRRAQTLILETDMPLADVALMTGFADQSHFTRRFHRHVGCTPAAFARNSGRRRSTRKARD
ncbi:helix-turn-helix domain-containing protein [Caballeronia terrestris]|nr:AraC family transcriptional regulator [Caballeronia terrestris]